MANTITLNEILQSRPSVNPTIYGYVLPDVPSHKGYIKIGYTDMENADDCIRGQLHRAGFACEYKILFTVSAMRDDGTCFIDKDVHKVLGKNGFRQLNAGEDRNEWYKCTERDALAAIEAVRGNYKMTVGRTATFKMRDEQKRAVEDTARYFIKSKEEDSTHPPKYLWNAKMRFGKTFASYQLAKKMGFKRVLVLTFKPAVESAWQEDLSSHIDFEGWQFVSDKEAKDEKISFDKLFDKCDKSKPIVVFGSFQNLLGTTENGGIKPKNEFIHATNWDIVIFDEYHFGAWRDNAKKLFENPDEEDAANFDAEKYQQDEAADAINESWIDITTNYYLYLSGTPFRALYTGEFLEDQIFNWTYSDEQTAKANWSGDGENPYAALPRMVMLTYKVPDSITQIAMGGEYDEFDLNEFFKAEYQEKGNPESAKFIYEDEVQKWLEMIRGNYMPVDGLKLGNDKPPMPFSDGTLKNSLTHTVWYLPNIASCFAMGNLLRANTNKFFNDYKVVVCAGTKAGTGLDALPPVKYAMDDPLKTKTITLSCGKLMTGVTVRPWSGIFMLCNMKSPETYFQSAFRVQSPWTTVNDKGQTEIVKPECYIFDFALNRALRQISDYSCRLKIEDNNPEEKVKDFIKFLPVLAFDGSSMNVISAQDVLDITYAGISATLLAKRWQTALLVHVDNDTLKRLQNNQDALDALMNIEGFRSLNADIETIINRSEKIKKAKTTDDDKKSKKDKQELSEEEKKLKSLRKQVQENLLKLAARIPSFMYLTDYREQTIKDVITQLQPELFKKVTGLSVKDFDVLCDIGLFDPEKMNQGIFGFRRYESSSLNYTGIDKHEGEDVGGWDTVLKREEYNKLYANQQATLSLASVITSAIDDIPEKSKKIHNNPVTKSKPSTVTEKYGINPVDNTSEKPKEEPPKPKFVMPNIREGMMVVHAKFGEGTITKYHKSENKINVSFEMGEKTFVIEPGNEYNAFERGFLKVK
ncbi:MAG: DEAD/DEAH box helicase family protein [Clostridia bacterium]|nr:DEAD/DEAH box helicase family protein [Clostridia bacterium]